MKWLTNFSFLILSNSLAYAGGWTSGGGELIRDTKNPWFLSNTTEVRYCIQINEVDFGQDKNFVSDKVSKAFQFWKRQLPDLDYSSASQGFQFILGTQKFIEVSCQQSHDIRFQFGVLDNEQKIRLGDLSKTVAVTVRTDYDQTQLKGKGFVYFNKNNQFEVKPWTRANGVRLLPVLIHEIGHIFGIQHSKEVMFMADDFAESLVSTKRPEDTDRWLEDENFYNRLKLFKYSTDYRLIATSCSTSIVIPKPTPKIEMQSIAESFFGVPASAECLSVYFDENKLIVKAGRSSPAIYGTAKLEQQMSDGFYGFKRRKNIIDFWIPEQQKVFPMDEFMKGYRLEMASFLPSQIYKGTYESLDKKTKHPVAVEVANYGSVLNVIGEFDQKIYVDLEAGY